VATVQPDRHRPQHDVIDARITGAQQLREVAAHIRNTGDKGLGRQFGRALEKAVEPLKKSIADSAERTMPSGYAPTLSRSLKHRRTTKTDTRQGTVRLATYGEGHKQRRDLPALEKGNLRHPVFGRSRSPWVQQRIRAGFHERGTEKAGGEAEKQILVVVDDYVQRLAEG
jgi:hypothetical protein